jgi:membrane protein implicated in regulation of membrane protease activity
MGDAAIAGGRGAATPVNVLATASGDLPAAMRLQILTTEHWSLLSTRALSWNEAFSRATTFLSALSGAIVALALVAQVATFGTTFRSFALLILPVVLFLGVATFLRLVQINREDLGWVIGMNLLRNAYLEAAPELRPYFISGWHDDEAGVMATYGATAGGGALLHEFVTTPGMLAVVDGVIAGVLGGIVGVAIGLAAAIAMALGVAVAAATVGLLVLEQYRGVVRPRSQRAPRFPAEPPGESKVAPMKRSFP